MHIITRCVLSTYKEIKMAGKIFYRQRTKIKEGAQTPRFRIIAVSELDLKIYGNHLRKKELKHIAKKCDAELIELKRDKKDR